MIVALARTTAGKVLLGAYAATAIICAFLPLADHVGFEFATVLTWTAGLFAPYVGFAAMRVEAERPPEIQRPARAAAFAGLFAVVALLLPVALILANGLRRPLCEPVAGSVWLFLLPGPTAWLSAIIGAVSRGLLRRTWVAALAVVALQVATVVASGLGAYFGPTTFAYDHFLGYFIGLARGSVNVTPVLVSFRTATIAWGAALITAAGALWTVDPAVRRMHRSWSVALTLALVIVSVGWGDDLGWRTSDASLRRELAGELRVDNLIIHYPRSASDRFVDLLTRDAVYNAAQVQRVLDIKPVHPVHIWVYESAQQKSRLVGTGATAFAKPYRHEIHLSGGFPHGSMRHELLHAFAAEFGTWPWGAAGGIIPNTALIEGLADAYDLEDGSLTLFQGARAMRELGIAPNLERMMSWTGFGGQGVSRAYGYSAAFVRYLDLRFGNAAVRQLYRTGDLAPLGGATLLVADFERMLDTVTSNANARSAAAREHSVPAATKRTCAREVYRVTDSALALAANRHWDAALRMYDHACALQPENPDLLSGKLSVAIRMRPPTMGPIVGVANDLLAHPRLDPTLAAQTHLRLGDAYLRYNDIAGARREYEAAAKIPAGPETRRGITVRLLSLDDSVRLNAVKRYFGLEGIPRLNLFRSIDAVQAHPNEPILLYLLGREFDLSDAHESAERVLTRASRIGLPDPDLARETERMLVTAYANLNRCDDAQRALDRFVALDGSRAERAKGADWVSRCRFAVNRGWRPM